MSRMGWDEYFMSIAELVSKRSTCLRRIVGAVAVKDKRILATGYNGVPSGLEHCDTAGCLRQELGVPSGQRHEICRGLHAEQNVIVQAAATGVSLDGAVLYCTTFPCVVCAKMLINAGFEKIYYLGDYDDKLSELMLLEADVGITKLRNLKGAR